MPLAILVTFMFKPSIIFFIYNAVVSPSILGFTAIIISWKLLLLILFINFSRPISSGSIPSRGDISPFITWYCPLYVPIFSNKNILFGS